MTTTRLLASPAMLEVVAALLAVAALAAREEEAGAVLAVRGRP
jgi:hypothetical protein